MHYLETFGPSHFKLTGPLVKAAMELKAELENDDESYPTLLRAILGTVKANRGPHRST